MFSISQHYCWNSKVFRFFRQFMKLTFPLPRDAFLTSFFGSSEISWATDCICVFFDKLFLGVWVLIRKFVYFKSGETYIFSLMISFLPFLLLVLSRIPVSLRNDFLLLSFFLCFFSVSLFVLFTGDFFSFVFQSFFEIFSFGYCIFYFPELFFILRIFLL